MKKVSIISVVALLALSGVGYYVWDSFVRSEVVYGSSSDAVDVAEYREDCSRRGGELNECGSPDGNILGVCYFICELR